MKSPWIRIAAWCVLLLTTACLREEDPLPAGGETPVLIAQGEDYGQAVYFKLSTGEQVSVPVDSWDLAFPTDVDSMAVRLNTGKLLLAWNSGQTGRPERAQWPAPTSFDWQTDAPHGWADSTALWGWHAPGSQQPTGVTFVLDRGPLFHDSDTARYRYLQMLGRDGESFRFRWATTPMDDWREERVALDRTFTHVYFTFDGGGRVVPVAPPRQQWDLVFTQYIQPFDELPPPGRWYLVRGTLSNLSQGVAVSAVTRDFDRYPRYENLSRANLDSLPPFRLHTDGIGYDWKSFDLRGTYYIRPDHYYVVRDPDGTYYRLRFVDFYDERGRRGFPQFVYDAL